jgi:hypothetical protein
MNDFDLVFRFDANIAPRRTGNDRAIPLDGDPLHRQVEVRQQLPNRQGPGNIPGLSVQLKPYRHSDS